MGVVSSWAKENWFNLFQTAGIVGSLWMAGAAAHREAKAREIENLLSISDHHRELWDEALHKPELKRVSQADVDIVGNPVTVAEEEFLNLVITHWLTSWRVARAGGIITVKELGVDAHAFFSLPLPRAVWEKTRAFRNPKFVRFVERAITQRPIQRLV